MKRVDQLEGHIEEIRGNYLDRFDELRQLLADIRVEQTKIKGCVEKIQSICALQHKMFTKKDE